MSEPTALEEQQRSLKTMTPEDMAAVPVMAQIRAAKASGMIPGHMQDEAALAIVLKAHELGVPPMAAFSSIYVIEGKPSCSAQLMLACARRIVGDSLKYEFESAADKCSARMSTDGGETWNRITITYAEMQEAGYTQMSKAKGGGTKANWKNPQAMLRARVVAALVRLCVPEATLGIYTPDEIRDSSRLEIGHVDTESEAVGKLLDVKPQAGEIEFWEGPPLEVKPEPGVDDDAPDEQPVKVDVLSEPDVEVRVEPDLENQAFLDWVEALDQADSIEQLDAHLEAIEADMRLDLALRAMLKAQADGVRARLTEK